MEISHHDSHHRGRTRHAGHQWTGPACYPVAVRGVALRPGSAAVPARTCQYLLRAVPAPPPNLGMAAGHAGRLFVLPAPPRSAGLGATLCTTKYADGTKY